MRDPAGWLPKAASVAVTLLTAAAAAGYVGGHVKNPRAPLQPPVAATPGPAGGGLGEGGGTTHLEPQVRVGNYQPVTSTYAS